MRQIPQAVTAVAVASAVTVLGLSCAGLVTAGLSAQGVDPRRQWARWRGPDATGVSATANPPVEWSETRNVKWKVEIPGRGHASPVVWNDRIFVLSAVPAAVSGDAQHAPRGGLTPRGTHTFVVMALDRQTGRTVWQRVATEREPHEAGHTDNSTWASSSPITDGESVFRRCTATAWCSS